MSGVSTKPKDEGLTAGADVQHFQVPAGLYNENDLVEQDLYLFYQQQYILFKSKGMKMLAPDIERLKEFGVSNLYMKFRSVPEHRKFLDKKMTSLLESSKASTTQKAKVLIQVSEPILTDVFKTPGSRENMEASVAHVKNCMAFLNGEHSIPELISLSSKRWSETAHALHTAAYAIALGQKLGRKAPPDVLGLGVGAILHDIGKTEIEEKILAKPGALNDDEWLKVRQHPLLGEKIVSKFAVIPPIARRIIAEHHERVNGKGYPKGIKSVHLFAQIVSVADVFNSLCSDREYAKARTPFEALKYMVTTMREEFEEEVLQAFVQMLGE